MGLPTINPITDASLGKFAAFLHENLDARRSAESWSQAFRVGWAPDQPNYGFMLKDEGHVVGGIGAFYADRVLGGRRARFCNITSWCVLDAYRRQSMRLALSLVTQPGYHYTDFSPTKTVEGVLQYLKFKPLDSRQTVFLATPWLSYMRRVPIYERPADIEARLDLSTKQIYRDHVRFPWLDHVLVGESSAQCYVIYKRWTYKGLPAARILYLSDADSFDRYFRAFSSHLLFRGIVSIHVDTRFVKRGRFPSRIRSGFINKLYLSDTLGDADIDYLYSESIALDL